MTVMSDLTFDCMGTTIRLVTDRAEECRAFLEDFDARLSRFRPGSELSRLNADPREEVPVSGLLHAAISAGLLAAELTGGLVDPTLLGALETSGYDRTRREPELALQAALERAPARAPAQPDPDERWRRITLTDQTVRRPPGLRLDTGGTGKGLAADLLASRLDGRFAIDCGGDIRVGGAHEVEVRHPLTRAAFHTLHVEDGAVATSGIDTRLWTQDGAPRHHLIDPSTGRPAWTGLISVTALAPTALEAEALAKAALLEGPRGAHRWLKHHGGLLITDDGDVHVV
jgi:thiamine biosynthesis lipoprotein